MNSLVQQQDHIEQQIKNIRKQVNAMNNKNHNKKNAAYLKIKNSIKTLNQLIQAYQIDLNIADLKGKTDQYRNQQQTLHNSLKQQMSQKKQQLKNQVQYDQSKKGVIEKGKKIQLQSKNALNNILRDIQDVDNQLNQINSQLNRQIEKLDQIYEQTLNTQTTLKRAEQHIKYFAKQIYTDKILICLIVLVVLAIIAVIILSIVGKVDSSVSDPFQKQ